MSTVVVSKKTVWRCITFEEYTNYMLSVAKLSLILVIMQYLFSINVTSEPGRG